jgi:hypothetical protein
MERSSCIVGGMQQRVSTMPDVFRAVVRVPNVACCAC